MEDILEWMEPEEIFSLNEDTASPYSNKAPSEEALKKQERRWAAIQAKLEAQRATEDLLKLGQEVEKQAKDIAYAYRSLLGKPGFKDMSRFRFSQQEAMRIGSQLAPLIKKLNPELKSLSTDEIAKRVAKHITHRNAGWLVTDLATAEGVKEVAKSLGNDIIRELSITQKSTSSRIHSTLGAFAGQHPWLTKAAAIGIGGFLIYLLWKYLKKKVEKKKVSESSMYHNNEDLIALNVDAITESTSLLNMSILIENLVGESVKAIRELREDPNLWNESRLTTISLLMCCAEALVREGFWGDLGNKIDKAAEKTAEQLKKIKIDPQKWREYVDGFIKKHKKQIEQAAKEFGVSADKLKDAVRQAMSEVLKGAGNLSSGELQRRLYLAALKWSPKPSFTKHPIQWLKYQHAYFKYAHPTAYKASIAAAIGGLLYLFLKWLKKKKEQEKKQTQESTYLITDPDELEYIIHEFYVNPSRIEDMLEQVDQIISVGDNLFVEAMVEGLKEIYWDIELESVFDAVEV